MVALGLDMTRVLPVNQWTLEYAAGLYFGVRSLIG
jgi:hypothetical protein